MKAAGSFGGGGLMCLARVEGGKWGKGACGPC
jgi:hypothetical protein